MAEGVMKPKPNQKLKQERVRRGWSQAKVAEALGIDTTTVSRWERGHSIPYPYFRERLCALFDKNIQELGLFSGEETSEQDQIHLTNPFPLYDPFIPPLSPSRSRLIGRDDVLLDLKQRLQAGTSVALSALHGLPGVGKTAIALHLAHESDLQTHFQDGTLWVGLGPSPYVLGHLSRWAALLGVSAPPASAEQSIETWAKALREQIGIRRMLVVIDDAWSLQDALAFQVGGPNCAYLLTTRFPHIALSFAPQGTINVGELTESQSLLLLQHMVPHLFDEEINTLCMLLQLVGGLPLALTLIGKYLCGQAYGGQHRRIQAALQHVYDRHTRLLLSTPQNIFAKHPCLQQETSLSLQAVIRVSDQHLDEQSRDALRCLSIFPAKPNSFSEAAAVVVCAQPPEVLDRLCDAGLLEGMGSDRYTLHQTIADYAASHLQDASTLRRFVTYWGKSAPRPR